MSADAHARIARLFEDAIALPPEERGPFVERMSRDAEEREALERLLASDERAGTFLERPVVEQLGRPHLAEAFEAEPELPSRIGSYAIERFLGAGTMGDVFLARQERTEQVVALKLPRGTWSGRDALRRFEREMRILGRLQHPGIARVLEAGRAELDSGERPYIAMEYVDGANLVEHARSTGADLAARVELLVQLCDAIEHAHGQGVIHRDLKPENVLVASGGRVKVLDFGVARLADPELEVTALRTRETQLIGTLAYMSPEQASGAVDRIDRRSDVYALGVVAYELFAGRRPLDLSGYTVLDAACALQTEEPEWLSSAAPFVPTDLAVVVHTALAKEPERRYATAGELAEDLRRWSRNEPITARPPSTLYTIRKLARRHRGLTAGLLCAFGALALGTVVSLVLAGRAIRASEEARWQTYLATLSAASSEVQAGSIEQARDRLRSTPEEHRGIEWNYLWNRTEQSRLVLEGHVFNVWNVALSPDGETVYSCAGDGTVRLWEARTGRTVRVLDDHSERVFSVAASPTGERFASGSADRTVRLRDAETLETVAVLEGHDDGIFGLAFSDDGGLLATGANDGSMCVWDAHDGTMLRRLDGHPDRIWVLAFAPASTLLASASADGTVRLWDAAEGTEVGVLEVADLPVHDVAFSSDGSTLAAVATESTGDKSRARPDHLQLWDVPTRRLLREASLQGAGLEAVEFLSERTLVTGRVDGGLDLWDADSLTHRKTLLGHTDWVQSLVTSADGELLVSSAWDDTVRVWSRRRIEEPVFPETISGLRTTLPSRRPREFFVLCEDGRFQLRDLLADEVLSETTHEGPAASGLVASAARDRLATRGPLLRVLDGEGIVRLELPGARWVAMSGDGRLIASKVDGESPVTVLDARTGERRSTLDEDLTFVSSLAFDPSGRHVLVAGWEDCTVRAFDVDSGHRVAVLEGHTNLVVTIAADRSGTRLVTGGHDRQAILWDAVTFAPLGVLPGHGASVACAAFSPDGSRIATATEDGKVRFWSSDSFDNVALLSVVPRRPLTMEFSSDGRTLVLRDRTGETLVLDGRPAEDDGGDG